MRTDKKMQKEKKIVLYGAGNVAHNIYRALCLSGYSVAYCVITNSDVKKNQFEDLTIYSFLEKKDEIIKKKYQIVIAVLRYEDEIIKFIEENGVTDFWKRNELPWGINLEKYNNFNKEDYLRIIKEKYLSNKKKYGDELTIQKYFEQNEKPNRNDKKITFLLLDGSSRAYRMIEALHKKGYIIELLIWINAARFNAEKYRQFEKISNKYVLCCDAEEVLFYYTITDSKLMHIIYMQWSDIELPQILIKYKQNFENLPALIFDEYDVFVGANQIQKVTEAELFCFANADGLCNRYRCMEFLEEQGYDICKRRIHFGDCCDDFLQCESPQKLEKDELQLVYVGILFSGKLYQHMKVAKYLEYSLRCQENKVHLHIYPSEYDAENLYNYIEMEKKNPYFHLHHPISWAELPHEISQYDFGISSAMHDFLGERDRNGLFEREELIYAESSKFYDYLAAGLPIVAAIPVKQTEELEKDGVLIRKFDEDVDFDELRKRRNEMKKRVMEVRDKYRISNQLQALIELYNSF